MTSPAPLRRRTPTADLYFANAMAAVLAPGESVRRTAPTVFETPEAVLVMRHDGGARVAWRDRRRLVYLLDDAVFAGLRDPTLPLSYRLKLWSVECAAARRLIPRAAALVVSAPEVAEALPEDLRRACHDVFLISPYWSETQPSLAHFDRPTPWRIGFSGAQTHQAGLRLAAAAMAPLMREDPELRFHLAANHRMPRRLRTTPGLRLAPETSWTAYREALPRQRRHVALYPVANTVFGRARSVNKLIEHALLGAAPIYAESWPRSRIALEAGAGLVAPSRVEAWSEAAMTLRREPERAREIAAAAQALARELNRPDPQRALWARLLGLRLSPAVSATVADVVGDQQQHGP